MPDSLPTRGVAVVYDGECPLCSAYTRYLRLAAAAGAVHLIDARRDPDVRRNLAEAGFDLDVGMVVAVDGVRYHGARAINVLALMSSPSGTLNRLFNRLLRFPVVALAIYPVLASGRRVLLALLGRRPLGDESSSNQTRFPAKEFP